MCGEVRFEIKNEALVSLLCHCKDCQKLSGSAFTSGVVFPKDSIFYEKKIPALMNIQGVQVPR